MLSVAYGVGVVLAGAAGLLLAVVLADYLLNLPAWPRLIIAALAGIAVAIGIVKFVLLPARARLGLADIAGKVESTFPVFEDRLRAVVEFSDRTVPGSDAMKQRVIAQAEDMAQAVDFGNTVIAKPTTLSLLGGLGAIVLLWLIGSFLVPNYAKIAAARLFSPFGENPWPKRQRIDVLSQTPQRLPAGQRFDVKMKLGKGDRSSLRATLFTQIGDGAPQQQLMIRNADGTYSAVVDTQTETAAVVPLKMWIKSGDDEVQITPITLVQRLAIQKVEARITPPPYASGLPPTTVNLGAAPAVAAIGSQIELSVTFNKDVAGEVTIDPVAREDEELGVSRELARVPQGSLATGPSRRLQFAAEKSMRFHLRATDLDGFQNAGIEEYELVVRPDQAPTIQIESPRRNEERTAESVVPLAGLAEDDYGIASVTLQVERLGDHKKWSIPLVSAAAANENVAWQRDSSSADRQRHRLGYSWDLSKLPEAKLASGDVLEYFLEATDNFYLGDQRHEPAASGRLRITIISQEELTTRVMDELRNARAQVGEVSKAQQRIKTETTELGDETKDKETIDAGQRTTAERLANQQSTAASQSRQLSQRIEAVKDRLAENRSTRNDLSELAQNVADLLDRTAEGAMKDASKELSTASQPNQQKDPRNAAMNKASENQQSAADQLQQAMDKLGDLGSLQQSIENISALLQQQQQASKDLAEVGRNNVGKKPEQMAPADRAKLNEVAERQAKLAEKSAAAIADLQKQAEQLEKSDPASAEAMKQSASAGQQQQVSPSQQKAAQSAKQNQQASAQQAQRQAELGLQMMLQQLKEAESRKLAELQKQLADLQKQVANLIRRQAGHNLDNVTLQGKERLDKLGGEALAALLAKSQRKPDQPVPTAGQLSGGQEQTERNARDIAKQSDGVPNAAEVSSKLIRAAGRMERANVQLRQNDLPGAYDPPQVEALAALEDARKLVDQMKEEVDKKIEEQKREQIRKVYERVKEAQLKLNTETARIDKSPRKEDGTLKREDLIRLGQLPGEQAKLSEEIKALEERLAALQSIVYVWANKDIADSMDQVKSRLNDKITGAPAQVEQARVVKQLEMMIKSLQENPIQSKFAQDGGGGGEGAQQQAGRLPDESELRLLKGLQGAVNDATSELSKTQPKDEPAIRGLGDRQAAFRKLLSDMLEKSSRGELTLGPEPDNRDQLPEEANEEAIDDQELDKELLAGEGQNAEAEQKKVMRVGDRMARSRQRLAVNLDPGKTTQLIQKRILDDLDVLIEQSRRQQAQARNSQNQQQQGEAQAQQRPQAGEQPQANNQGDQSQQNNANNAADQSNTGGGLGQTGKAGANINETLREWGALSPRQRDAIIEGSGENVIEAYKKLVDDYYKSLATKATEK